jgi:hypothetical protein
MANMKYLVLLLTTSACGAPFTAAIPDADAHQEAGESEESSLPETGSPDVVAETGPEATPPVDSPVDDGSDAVSDAVSDAGSDAEPADTGPCLPPTSYDYKILSGGSTFVGYAAPAECQCAATYTCACLLATPNVCTSSFGSPTGCSAGLILTVDCSP